MSNADYNGSLETLIHKAEYMHNAALAAEARFDRASEAGAKLAKAVREYIQYGSISTLDDLSVAHSEFMGQHAGNFTASIPKPVTTEKINRKVAVMIEDCTHCGNTGMAGGMNPLWPCRYCDN